MLVHNYDPETGEFMAAEAALILPGREEMPDSDLSKFQIPAHCTLDPPPAVQDGEVALWDGSAWNVTMDCRGQTWYGGPENRDPIVVETLGNPQDNGYLPAPAPLTQEEIAQQALERIESVKREVVSFAESIGRTITGHVPEHEKEGWDAKGRAAVQYDAAYQASGDHDFAYEQTDPVGRLLIDSEIAITSEDWPGICAKIIDQAFFMAIASGKIAAVRRNTMAAIDELGPDASQEDLDAILASAKAVAEAEFEALMASA